MSLPLDLVIVRHGQSEGNKAKRLAEAGNPESFNQAVKGRHSRSFRLTQRGREQAMRTGAWLREEFGFFDRYIVSEYARAMETAALFDLTRAEWYGNFFLTERDWGDIETSMHSTQEDREEYFRKALRMRDIEPFFWRPPNGESLAHVCLRVDRVLATLHRECSDKRVILVCHGEVMWVFRVLIERMSQQRFRDLYLSTDPYVRLYNCQILHYTRRDPETNNLDRHANWMRTIRATEDPVWVSDWQHITRPRYTNAMLASIAEEHSPVLD